MSIGEFTKTKAFKTKKKPGSNKVSSGTWEKTTSRLFDVSEISVIWKL